MEGIGVEDTRQRFTVDIRILAEKKKSSYCTARVKGFPVTETCEDFRKEVQNILPGTHDETNIPSSSITEKIDDYIHSLKERHGESGYQPYQYKLWAEMLALGSHKSQEEPPMLPIFRNKIAKKTQPAASSSTSTMGTSVPGNSRSEILRQLRELNELKQMDVLTDEEFADKKKVLLNDLN
ncbi:hypothetical protein OS493_000326 [Desmophyllum pertusum]|uniref:SHOCT domain-containing protein n=1 Tax=Desmophyllum pertusum TaxID=174260 RepID=A0A9X0DBJ8_9CNID|nr:hypothetical protein OS493_000326 [Desmophyllum pertusum]